jgi:hypothetical protein
MARFNEWQTENYRGLSLEERLQQFLVLYNLGKLHNNEVLNKIHEDHLMGLVKTGERLRK